MKIYPLLVREQLHYGLYDDDFLQREDFLIFDRWRKEDPRPEQFWWSWGWKEWKVQGTGLRFPSLNRTKLHQQSTWRSLFHGDSQSYRHKLVFVCIFGKVHKLDDEVEGENVDEHSSHQDQEQTRIPVWIQLQKSIDFASLRHSSHHQATPENDADHEEGDLRNERLLFLSYHQQQSSHQAESEISLRGNSQSIQGRCIERNVLRNVRFER